MDSAQDEKEHQDSGAVGVYLTVPNGDGWIHKHTHFAVCKILSDRRYRVRHDCPTNRPYVDNLHACMNDFLDHEEDFWLSFDTDNPPTKNPLDLVSEDLDVVGFPTPVWHSEVKGNRPYYYNAMRESNGGYAPHEDPTEGLQEVDAIGSGCFMVARRVMLKLRDSMPFMRQWNRNGRVDVGCDFSFCRKAKEAGFRIWADFSRPCEHFNELPLLEVIRSFGEMERG